MIKIQQSPQKPAGNPMAPTADPSSSNWNWTWEPPWCWTREKEGCSLGGVGLGGGMATEVPGAES